MTIDYQPSTFGAPIPGTRFSVNDLVFSSTALKQGILNLPPVDMLPQITNLAHVLQKIWDKIGPFELESAYRTPELQAALRDITPQASKRSWHVKGLAADIHPTAENADSFFAKILASPLYDELGEVALKTDPHPDRTIHFSLGTQYGGRSTKPMRVISGKYYTMSEADRVEMIKTFGLVSGGVIAAVAAGVGAYMLVKKLQERQA